MVPDHPRRHFYLKVVPSAVITFLRCKVLTWQELSMALPQKLRKFLEVKYGIACV
jgi:hypothetical protein